LVELLFVMPIIGISCERFLLAAIQAGAARRKGARRFACTNNT